MGPSPPKGERWGQPGDMGTLMAQGMEPGKGGPCHPGWRMAWAPCASCSRGVPGGGWGAQGCPGAAGTSRGLGSTGGFMERERSRVPGRGPQGGPPGAPSECMRVSPRARPGGLAGVPPSECLCARGRLGGGGLSGGTSSRRGAPSRGARGRLGNGAPGCTRLAKELAAGGVTGHPEPPVPCSRCSSSSRAALGGGPGPGGSGQPGVLRWVAWPRRCSATRSWGILVGGCGVASGVGSSGVSRRPPAPPWGGNRG